MGRPDLPLRTAALLTASLGLATLWLHPHLDRPLLLALAIGLLWPSLAIPCPAVWPGWRLAWDGLAVTMAVPTLAVWAAAPGQALPLLVLLIAVALLRWAYTPRGLGAVRLTVALSTALVVLASLATESAWFAPLGAAFLLSALITLRLSERQMGTAQVSDAGAIARCPLPPRTRRHVVAPLALTLSTAALGAALFALFPRLRAEPAAPILDPDSRRQYALTGMSSRIELGAYSALLEDDSPTLRVTWLGATPPPEPLFMRASALARLERSQGRWVWGRIPTGSAERQFEPEARTPLVPGAEISPAAVHHRVELLDPDLRTLFALPWAVAVRGPGGVLVSESGGRWRSRNLTERWGVYEVWSDPRRQPAQSLSFVQREEHLRLPTGLRLSVRAFVEERGITEPLDPPAQQVQAIINHLRAEHRHSLDLREIDAENPLEDFLFNGRAGNCEHFASAMTVMCRALGVPARMVTGFHGGETEGDGTRLFRARDAHAWVEVWREGEGWVTMDPTPPAPLVAETNLGLWSGLGANLTGLTESWRERVVRYRGAWHRDAVTWSAARLGGLGRVLTGDSDLLGRTVNRLADTMKREPRLWLFHGGVLALNLLAAWALLRWHRERVRTGHPAMDSRERALRRIARALAPHPRVRAPGETAGDYLRSLTPDPDVEDLVSLYYRRRHRPGERSPGVSDLVSRARALAVSR